MSNHPVLPESAYSALGLPPSVIRILMNLKPPPPSTAAPELHQNATDFTERLPENESHIMLYAELLLHIRTITLFASLRSHHTRETKARLDANGNLITVSHEGYKATIRLPIQVDGRGDAALELPAQPPSKELTLRLQMEEQEHSEILGLMAEARKTNIVPWNGVTLSKQDNGIEARCKNCEGVVLKKEAISEWKDLPNENWAEMMDFWHCHKPDEDHLHDHTHEIGRQKGYAAGNRLTATEGTVFVDLTSLLLKEQDCDGAKISTEEGQSGTAIVCKHCTHTLGRQDTATEGWRIWKWCLSLSSGTVSSPLYSTYSVQKWISARLLHLIENCGVRKFKIHPEQTLLNPSIPTPSTVPSILLWIFTPDLMFSSSISSPHRTDPTRAIKCFFKKQTWVPLRPGEPESATIEDVEFPQELYEELEKSLDDSQDVLPATARKFQEWDVGLLERFDVGEEVFGGGENKDQTVGTDESRELFLGDDNEEKRGRQMKR